jgi:hypothetical protein
LYLKLDYLDVPKLSLMTTTDKKSFPSLTQEEDKIDVTEEVGYRFWIDAQGTGNFLANYYR